MSVGPLGGTTIIARRGVHAAHTEGDGPGGDG
jgi:hypothetical protein